MRVACRVALALICVIAAMPLTQAAEDTMRSAVIVYGLNRIDEESYQRILQAPEITYVCFQQIMPEGPLPALVRMRCAELVAAGKRPIAQIWWGPSWPYPWSKYSYANIALDAQVREDFWREVVDRCIDEIGPENLWGAHLQEETGMQFGVDVQQRDDPDDFDTFEDTGSSYDHPFWSGWKKTWYGKTDIPNVIRHEEDFRALVGFGFEDDENWERWQWHLFDRWVSTRLQSGGMVQFADHIHEKYRSNCEGEPLRAYTWDGLLWGGENPRTNHHLEAEHFDGVISDVYGNVGHGYMTQRAYRMLYPDKEIIHFGWGGMRDRVADVTERRHRVLPPYVAGHDVLGFWSMPADYDEPDVWQENLEILREVNKLPRFESSPRLLVISARVSDIYSLPYSLTGLTHFDILPMWEAWDVDLSAYDTLILDSTSAPGSGEMLWDAEGFAEKYHFPGLLDYRRINAFVREGGAIIIRGRWNWEPDCPLFPVAEGYVHTPEEGARYNELDFEFTPEGWWRDELGLTGRYAFGRYANRVAIDRPDDVQVCPAGLYFEYGEGACLMIPYHRDYDKEEDYGSEKWLSHRQLMTDLMRGFLLHAGKGETAAQCIADPAIGNTYRRAVSADGALEAWYLTMLKWSPGLRPIALQGTDALTGIVDPVLDPEFPCAVLPAGE